MQELDWGIGELMEALEESGVAENTIVIFTSDNGPTRNEYAQPFRGTKYVTFEGGHRVPFIIHWPARIRQGRVLYVAINAMDLFPTLSEVIGARMPRDRMYDDTSLLPLLDGKPLARSVDLPFYYYNCENLQAIRQGDWKLHLRRNAEQIPFWDKNKGFLEIENPVLYNLRTDPSESNDVASKNPEVVKQILGLAKEARAELGEFMQRGKGQRPTGSAIANAPIISHEKDWGMVDASTDEAITRERWRRHPETAPKEDDRH